MTRIRHFGLINVVYMKVYESITVVETKLYIRVSDHWLVYVVQCLVNGITIICIFIAI